MMHGYQYLYLDHDDKEGKKKTNTNIKLKPTEKITPNSSSSQGQLLILQNSIQIVREMASRK